MESQLNISPMLQLGYIMEDIRYLSFSDIIHLFVLCHRNPTKKIWIFQAIQLQKNQKNKRISRLIKDILNNNNKISQRENRENREQK